MDKVRFGVVGTNKITDMVIAGGLQDSRFEVTAVCSRTQERAEEFASRHKISHTFTSLEEMASSDLIDAVYIATPNCCHAGQAILCMNHGKHVLCEKPMASNAAEVRKMIAAARKNNVTLMEAMISTLNPNFLELKKNINRIGTVRRFFSSYCQYSSRYDKFKQGIVLNAFRADLSNGAMMDIGIYTVYPMIALFGKPEKIEAQGVVLSTGVDGQGAVNFQYPGMNATVLYSKIANSFLPTEIEGEEGNLIMDQIHIPHRLELVPRIKVGQGESQNDIRTDLSIPLDKSEYFYEIREFIDLILEGKKESEINALDISLASIEVIDEIRRQLGVRYPADESGS